MRTSFRLLLVLALFSPLHTVQPQKLRTLTRDMHLHRFHSEVMSQDRTILVMLPPGYDAAPTKRYPVLYMHDGQSVLVNWHIDERLRPFFESGEIQPIILVAIYNGDTQEERTRDYTPTFDPQFPRSGNADAYGQMIVKEIKTIVDAEYRTLPDQADTAIGGTSLGGLVSIYLALKHSDTFGKAAVMSPSVWWDRGKILSDVKRLKLKPALKIWLDVGSDEGENSIFQTQSLRDALIAKGWKRDDDLKYVEAKGAAHLEEDFARRAPDMLKFLFPGRP